MASPWHSADRGASEVVAFVLLIGIVMMGIAAVLLIGGPEILASQEEVEIRQTERAMTHLDASADRIVSDSSDTQEVDLGLRGHRGTLNVEPNQGNITVNYIDSFEDGAEFEVVAAEMGTVRYENGDTTVAYQGGGVWRSDGDNSTMVSPPQLALTHRTLEVPVVTLAEDGSVHTDLQLSQTEGPRQHYPNHSKDFQNKVGPSMIHITVESEYYQAWGQYFEDETGAVVQYNHEQERVTVLLTGLPLDWSPTAGVVSTSETGEIRLEGHGAYVDSYNSTEGSYVANNDSGGIVRSAYSVAMFGSSQIDGDVYADTDIEVGSAPPQINGSANAGDRVYEHNDQSVTGEVQEDAAGVPSIAPLDPLIGPRMAGLQSENDNKDTPVIKDRQLVFDEENDTLTDGEYYLEEVELEDQTLVLDTTDGNITLGVENWIALYGSQGQDGPGVIEVDGPNHVRVFVNSSERMGPHDPHFYVEDDAAIETVYHDAERAQQFQVLGPSWFDGEVVGSQGQDKDTRMTGMIIAPAGPDGGGDFYVKHGDVYGSVLAGTVTLEQHGQVHFDHALKDITIPVGEQIPRVEYMYVTEHELKVQEAD